MIKCPQNKYKDLSIGDSVEFKTKDLYGKKEVSGIGTVIGFGKFDETHVIWLEDDYNNKIYGPTYEEVKRI